MKVLHITPECPAMKSGGKLGVLQTLLSIKDSNSIDYVGPDELDPAISALYSSTYGLERCDALFHRLFDLVVYHVMDSRFRAWKALKIDSNHYACVVLDFTKQSYILDRINPDKLIVRIHNVEKDFAKRDYLSKHSIVKLLAWMFAAEHERKLIDRAKILVVLSQHDKNRLIEMYGDAIARKITIVPVCVEAGKITQIVHRAKVNLLFTGSLWYGQNCKGALWLINHVCPLLQCEYCLTIAGSNPQRELVSECEGKPQIKLVDSPADMSAYFIDTDIVLVPVFDGAGMKVKVAEAFSYGKPVIGTTHAFVGYEIEEGLNAYVAESAEEFAEKINSYSRKTPAEKCEMSNRVFDNFNARYSIIRSIELWNGILECVARNYYPQAGDLLHE